MLSISGSSYAEPTLGILISIRTSLNIIANFLLSDSFIGLISIVNLFDLNLQFTDFVLVQLVILKIQSTMRGN